MPTVYNWQLGRPMHYPYDQASPKEQFAFVININRCIGCQTCTMACKSTWTFAKGQEHMWWTNVESKPYGGYPQHWDVRTLDLLEQANPGKQQWSGHPNGDAKKPYGGFDGRTVFENPEFVARGEQPNQVLGYLPTDEEWRFPNIHEDVPKRVEQADGFWRGRRSDRWQKTPRVVLLSGPAMQSLFLPRMPGGLSTHRDLQAAGRWNCADRPE